MLFSDSTRGASVAAEEWIYIMELEHNGELHVCDRHYELELQAAIADWARAPAAMLHPKLVMNTGFRTVRIHHLCADELRWAAMDLRLVPELLCEMCALERETKVRQDRTSRDSG